MSRRLALALLVVMGCSHRAAASVDDDGQRWAMYIRSGKDMTLVVIDREAKPVYFAAEYGEQKQMLIVDRKASSDPHVTFDNSFILIQLDPAFINIYPTSSGHAVRLARGNAVVAPFSVAPSQKADAGAGKEAAVFRVADGFGFPKSLVDLEGFSLESIHRECQMGHASLDRGEPENPARSSVP